MSEGGTLIFFRLLRSHTVFTTSESTTAKELRVYLADDAGLAPVPEGPNESSLVRSAWKQEKSGSVPEGRLICSLVPMD